MSGQRGRASASRTSAWAGMPWKYCAERWRCESSPHCCAQIVAGSAELLLRFEWTFENAFGKFATIIRTFPGLQLFRKQFFRARFADCRHRFDLGFIGNPQFFARTLVIESLHPVHDQ